MCVYSCLFEANLQFVIVSSRVDRCFLLHLLLFQGLPLFYLTRFMQFLARPWPLVAQQQNNKAYSDSYSTITLRVLTTTLATRKKGSVGVVVRRGFPLHHPPPLYKRRRKRICKAVCSSSTLSLPSFSSFIFLHRQHLKRSKRPLQRSLLIANPFLLFLNSTRRGGHSTTRAAAYGTR